MELKNVVRHIEVKRSRSTARRTDNSKHLGSTTEMKEDYEYEQYLNPDAVKSLLPSILCDGYDFWRTGKHVDRGHAKLPRAWKNVFREPRGEATDTLYLPLNYRTMGTGTTKLKKSTSRKRKTRSPTKTFGAGDLSYIFASLTMTKAACLQ